jgi:lipopolysaccharide export system ATP-binding protein
MQKQTFGNINVSRLNANINVDSNNSDKPIIRGSGVMNTVRESSRSATVVLRADGLVKIYGKRRVVDGVSFHVNKGEIVGLLGPNGAGKTTSFRMVCGLISSNGGIVHLGPHDITNWPMYRRSREGGMGYLPQDKSVFQKLSVQNNLLAIMEMIGIRRQDRMTRCDELLEKFKLTHLRRNLGASLSGGEKRRLEIARSLVSNPKIILLDEPFAAVDPITVTSIQSIIRQLSNEGISILITDHSVQDTLQITHRSYVIRTGQVLCHGEPEEVLSNPEARKVYFGDNVSVGQIKTSNLHPSPKINSTNFVDDNIVKNNKISSNDNLGNSSFLSSSVRVNNFQGDTQLSESESESKIISDTKITRSRIPRDNQDNNVRNELFVNKASDVILSNDRNYSARPEVVQEENNRKSRIIKNRITSDQQAEEISDDFITPQYNDSQSSIISTNDLSNNSTRPATRRLIPSSSSIILPASERSAVRNATQKTKIPEDSKPSASGIMKVLGAMFFRKDS